MGCSCFRVIVICWGWCCIWWLFCVVVWSCVENFCWSVSCCCGCFSCYWIGMNWVLYCVWLLVFCWRCGCDLGFGFWCMGWNSWCCIRSCSVGRCGMDVCVCVLGRLENCVVVDWCVWCWLLLSRLLIGFLVMVGCVWFIVVCGCFMCCWKIVDVWSWSNCDWWLLVNWVYCWLFWFVWFWFVVGWCG